LGKWNSGGAISETRPREREKYDYPDRRKKGEGEADERKKHREKPVTWGTSPVKREGELDK